MSKSTPISSLPNMNNADNERENQLVKEILDEIDNSNTPASQQANAAQMQAAQMAAAQAQAQHQAQMNAHAQAHAQGHVSSQNEQQILDQQQQLQQMSNELNDDSLQNKIISMVKMPAIVGVIVILLSIPQVNELLGSLLKSKQVLVKNAKFIVPLLKGLIAGALFFAVNKSL